MKNLYLFVPNENVDNYIKYGIKLSQNANKVVTYERAEKKGIISYLSPMDSEKYYDNNFTCLKINISKLNILIYNETALDLTNNKDFICNIKDYIYGNYEEPRALICSTILPDHIFIYNKCVILCRLGVCVWTQKKPLRPFWKRLRTERLLPNR